MPCARRAAACGAAQRIRHGHPPGADIDGAIARSPFKSVVWLVCLCLGTLVLRVPFIQKTNPGGPFVSFFGDVVPILASLVLTVAVALWLRRMTSRERLISLVLLIVPAVVIAVVVTDVLGFWFWPNARGEFLGL